jgi:hypothetical protein
MANKILSKASFLLVATAVIGSTQAAQAAPPQCAAGSGAKGVELTIGDITGAAGFQCYIGDKLYENFSFGGLYLNTDRITISDNTAFHNLQSTRPAGNFGPGAYNIDYDVRVWTGNNFISGYTAGADVSAANSVWSKSLTATSPASPTTQTSNLLTNPSNLVSIVPPSKTVKFSSLFSVTTGALNSATDTIYQTVIVPGPLPILGAGVAFAYSRKLRSRIKAAA